MRTVRFFGVAVLALVMCLAPLAPANAAGKKLKIGSTGSDVTTLQLALKANGYFNYYRTTTYLGPITKRALKRWEEANGYKVNGKIRVGSKAWHKLVGTTKRNHKPPKFCRVFGATSKVLCASKKDGRLYAIKNGRLVDWATISFGGVASDRSGPWFTREGVFPIGGKQLNGYSNLYDDIYGNPVEMPFWMPFDGGQGIHYSSEFNSGYPYSHGCIGIKYKSMAKWFYNWTPEGTPLIVTSA